MIDLRITFLYKKDQRVIPPPSVKFIYEATDSTRLYLSYAEGYKAGGFDGSENAPQINATTPAPTFQFRPEEASTIELGAKMNMPENTSQSK